MPELNTLQKWMTSIIVRPGSLPDKIRLADRHYALDHTELICSTESLDAGDKIGIYARGYVLRLMECMEAEFPALQHLLGGELFDTFATTYLSRLPPSSFNLYALGQNFPGFLEAIKPAPETVALDQENFALPAELARLERAISEVSRSIGLEKLNQHTCSPDAENFPFFFIKPTDFRAVPCLQLLRQPFNLVDFIKAVQQNQEAATPKPSETFVGVTRVNYNVQLFVLDAWKWQFLAALQNHNTFEVAVEQCTEISGIGKEKLLADLLLWFPIAENSGLIFRI